MSGLSFSINEIMAMLPHRYPFLLIDKAYGIEAGIKGKGEKLYTINEWFFQGHFPENPIVPGVLLIESAAQLTAVVYQSVLFKEGAQTPVTETDKNIQAHVGYLAKANIKFAKPVYPGDTVITTVEIKKKLANVSAVEVKAESGRSLIMSGELFVSEK